MSVCPCHLHQEAPPLVCVCITESKYPLPVRGLPLCPIPSWAPASPTPGSFSPLNAPGDLNAELASGARTSVYTATCCQNICRSQLPFHRGGPRCSYQKGRGKWHGFRIIPIPQYVDLNGALTLMSCPMSQSSSHSARPPPRRVPNRRKNAPGKPTLSRTPPLIRRLQRREEEEDRRGRKPPRWFVPLTTSLQRPHPHQKRSHGRN